VECAPWMRRRCFIRRAWARTRKLIGKSRTIPENLGRPEWPQRVKRRVDSRGGAVSQRDWHCDLSDGAEDFR
jgi:hypothetical protein